MRVRVIASRAMCVSLWVGHGDVKGCFEPTRAAARYDPYCADNAHPSRAATVGWTTRSTEPRLLSGSAASCRRTGRPTRHPAIPALQLLGPQHHRVRADVLLERGDRAWCPGIGAMSSPWASSQASATCAGRRADLARRRPRPSRRSRMFASRLPSANRGLLLAEVVRRPAGRASGSRRSGTRGPSGE